MGPRYSGAVLPQKEIERRLILDLHDPESLVITPFLDRDAAFDSDSVDLRLGRHFLLPRTMQQPFFCPDSDSQANLHTHVFVPLGRYLVVPAHQTVLGATLEFIKLPQDVCGEILTKSSVARSFTPIETAPWIHPEYRGCLTLEIANVSNTPVLLYPGRLIGQLILLRLAEVQEGEGAEPADKPEKSPLGATYFGPIYPEPPKFNNPDDDLWKIGVRATWRISEIVICRDKEGRIIDPVRIPAQGERDSAR